MDGHQGQQQQQQQPPFSGVSGPSGRRLHIAHRRSPSELTPLVSMYTANPGSESIFPLVHISPLFQRLSPANCIESAVPTGTLLSLELRPSFAW